ncbi:MAG: hypothetical protein IJF61_02510 [Clostridia bacterium]|nr:hypothetical protein [Clostridia bacterium]
MKKSTIAIISSLCTLVVCLGIYLMLGNASQSHYYESADKEFLESIENNISQVPKKSSRAYIYVANTSIASATVNLTDIATSQQMYPTCCDLFTSDSFQKSIKAEYPDIEYEAELKQTDNSEVFEIRVTCESKKYATQICNTIANMFHKEIGRIFSQVNYVIIDKAK